MRNWRSWPLGYANPGTGTGTQAQGRCMGGGCGCGCGQGRNAGRRNGNGTGTGNARAARTGKDDLAVGLILLLQLRLQGLQATADRLELNGGHIPGFILGFPNFRLLFICIIGFGIFVCFSSLLFLASTSSIFLSFDLSLSLSHTHSLAGGGGCVCVNCFVVRGFCCCLAAHTHTHSLLNFHTCTNNGSLDFYCFYFFRLAATKTKSKKGKHSHCALERDTLKHTHTRAAPSLARSLSFFFSSKTATTTCDFFPPLEDICTAVFLSGACFFGLWRSFRFAAAGGGSTGTILTLGFVRFC